MAIGDLKTRLRAKFSRRNSTASSTLSSVEGEQQQPQGRETGKADAIRSTTSRGRAASPSSSPFGGATIDEGRCLGDAEVEVGAGAGAEVDVDVDCDRGVALHQGRRDLLASTTRTTVTKHVAIPLPEHKVCELQLELESSNNNNNNNNNNKHDSTSTDFPTPNTDIVPVPVPVPEEGFEEDRPRDCLKEHVDVRGFVAGVNQRSIAQQPPSELQRRQSLLPQGQTRLIKTLLETQLPSSTKAANLDYFSIDGPSTISPNMVSRKIWVKRPNQSATLVTINEDDLVDDVREMILRKYANSLGRSFDSPDVTLRIWPREQRPERVLGPEEPMGRTLDAYFPGGQTVDEALVIDVPLRRTPKASPHTGRQYYDEGHRPSEAASEYFPPMPAAAAAPPSPRLPNTLPASHPNHSHPSLAQHSMSVLTTGHVPALPSPGSRRPHHGQSRPRIGRQHTSSPTIMSNHQPQQVANNGTHVYSRVSRPRTHSSSSEKSNAPPSAPPPPTPPPTLPAEASQIQRVSTPPPRVSSPRPTNRPKRKKANADHPSLPAGMLNGAVPPINVLIVEDNIINLKLLEAFMKRLKVRWQTAMNGKEAVTKWRSGGFHLVLMDIQLPIMSGLEATKEIRRLERLNSIGVFNSSASSSAPDVAAEEAGEGEKLGSDILFKSPVIIVALTASSLQSDRHEALAAGCNDFLTKVSPPPFSLSPFPFIFSLLTTRKARQLRLARTQSHGMGLHAGTHRFRWLAQMEGFLGQRGH
ncbi:hypothetical protein BJ875DRAFT_477303 [Amylocarpus encephaloides]|uniref:Response regulatory domain-containing protein n=1 Tax=Amylocarpus encephaloides TaxID=45428 RepID=A0A9P7Y8Q1_9HELO|nr:hypothetical protein BJ875DRAFT_477303 [Amylocarpus encephaloides]